MAGVALAKTLPITCVKNADGRSVENGVSPSYDGEVENDVSEQRSLHRRKWLNNGDSTDHHGSHENTGAEKGTERQTRLRTGAV